MTITDSVKIIIDELPEGFEFHGSDLHARVIRIYPRAKFKYTDSILRMMRRWRRKEVQVINRNKSLYRKVKNE